MRYAKWLWPLGVAVMLGGCQPPEQVQRRPIAPERQEPANRDFIGKAWISTSPGMARGSVYVFLPNRTLLLASCSESFRLVEWGVAGDNRIRWREHAVPIEAEVILPSADTLKLRIVGRDHEMDFVSGWAPYRCPKTE